VRFSSAFRATAVGFAASSILPARAGEVIRPYFLARHEHMSATGPFATIILERLLDVVAVLVLLALYVFVFDQDLSLTNPVAVKWLKGIGVLAAAGALGALVVLFILAGDPAGSVVSSKARPGGSVVRWNARAVRRKIRARARCHPPTEPSVRRAALVLSFMAVDCGRHLGGCCRVSA
jgi:hypothetical protein